MNIKITNLVLFFLSFICVSQAQVPEIKNVKRKTIKIENQNFFLDKGYIEVPEDNEKPTGRILKLPVQIYRSNNANAKAPIFWLNGGPGASNLVKLTSVEFLKNHDVVMVGYRGADGNSVLNSKKINKAMKGKNHALLSNASLDHAEKAMGAYFMDLKKEGIDIRKYTMLEVIDDLEYVRKALRANQINIYSASYGTRVALLYSYKYPEVIQRTVMYGVNPPGHFFWFPEKTEEILGIYDSLYKAQQLPEYRGSIKEAMKKALDDMPKRWRGLRLDKDKIKCMTFGLMFDIGGSVMMFDAYFKAANEGDYSGLYLLQLFFDVGMSRTEAWGDMLTKGVTADLESGKDYRTWLRSYDKSTVLGANYGLLLWGLTNTLDITLIPEEYRTLRKCDTPVLLVSGNLDVSTPAQYATEKLLPTLTNGQQIIVKDASHRFNPTQKSAVTKIMAQYFDAGVVDASSIQYTSIDFKPQKTLTKMAKRAYPLWVVLSWIY